MLTRISRYLKIDLQTHITSGSILVVAKIVSVLATFALTYILANYLSPETYGVYKFFLSCFGVIAAFTFAGITEIITTYVARDNINYLRSVAQYYVKWQLPILSIGITIAGYYYYQGNNEFFLAFIAIAIGAPLTNVLGLGSCFQNGLQKYSLIGYLSIAQSVFVLTASIVIIFFGGGPLLLFFSYLLSLIITRGYVFIYTLLANRDMETGDLNNEQSQKARQFSINKILQKISFSLDSLALFHFLGPASVAYYSFATAIPKEIQGLNKILKILTIPRFSKQNLVSIKSTLHRKVFIYFIFMSTMCALYIALAPILFHTIFPQYTSSILYSQVFSITLLFAPQALYRQALTAHLAVSKLNIYDVLLAGSKIVLFLILIPPFGIWGAIAAFIAARALGFMTVLTLFQRSV